MKRSLCMSWYKDFQCIGGGCPLTCCTTDWNIALLEQEIEMYENMQQPFKKEILQAVDKERKCFKGDQNKNCRMLTEDGWCKIVRECGAEYLSNTCKQYPRRMEEYGDVCEATVDITCPHSASFLLSEEEILFDYGEIETEEKVKKFRYESYDALSFVRNYLIDFWQDVDGIDFAKKFFVTQHLYFKICDEEKSDDFHMEEARRLVDSYCKENLEDLFRAAERIFSNIDLRIKVLHSFFSLSGHLVFQFISIPEMKEKIDIFNCWLEDVALFQSDVLTYLNYFNRRYPKAVEKYYIYTLFLYWMKKVSDAHGEKAALNDDFLLKNVEWIWIQLVAAAYYKRDGQINDFHVLTARIDRIFDHSPDYKRKMQALIHEQKFDDEAKMLLIAML